MGGRAFGHAAAAISGISVFGPMGQFGRQGVWALLCWRFFCSAYGLRAASRLPGLDTICWHFFYPTFKPPAANQLSGAFGLQKDDNRQVGFADLNIDIDDLDQLIKAHNLQKKGRAKQAKSTGRERDLLLEKALLGPRKLRILAELPFASPRETCVVASGKMLWFEACSGNEDLCYGRGVRLPFKPRRNGVSYFVKNGFLEITVRRASQPKRPQSSNERVLRF